MSNFNIKEIQKENSIDCPKYFTNPNILNCPNMQNTNIKRSFRFIYKNN